MQPIEHASIPQAASPEPRKRQRGSRGRGDGQGQQWTVSTQRVSGAPTNNSQQLPICPAPSQVAPEVPAQAPPPPKITLPLGEPRTATKTAPRVQSLDDRKVI